jgi:TRAP-type C4-dicarboxylate transport system permease small subunit
VSVLPPAAARGPRLRGRFDVAAHYRLETVLETMSALAMFAIMLILVADALGRYLITSPLPWAHDVVARVLLPAVFFLTLSSALRVNQHVNIDIVYDKLEPRGRGLATIISAALALALFVAIAAFGARAAHGAFVAGETMSGAIEWPVWLYMALVPIGVAPLVVRLAIRVVETARRVARGEPPPDFAPRKDDGRGCF